MASTLGFLTNNLLNDGPKLSGFEDYTEEQYEFIGMSTCQVGISLKKRSYLPVKLSIAIIT